MLYISVYMFKLNINPLSVNKCRKGRRYKTNLYNKYEKRVAEILLPLDIAKKTPLFLQIQVWFSSTRSDLDNILKPFIDILQKKYWIDDRWIYEISCSKEIVKKGKEYIQFKLENNMIWPMIWARPREVFIQKK